MKANPNTRIVPSHFQESAPSLTSTRALCSVRHAWLGVLSDRTTGPLVGGREGRASRPPFRARHEYELSWGYVKPCERFETFCNNRLFGLRYG